MSIRDFTKSKPFDPRSKGRHVFIYFSKTFPLSGLSPDLQSMEQIRRVMRPTDVPDQGLLCDLLWADPDKDVLGWGENDRGVSFTFGADVVAKFLHKHDMDLICRAHQVMFTSLVTVSKFIFV